MDIEYEARGIARTLDQSRGDEAARRLSQDSQMMDPRAYSQLLRTVNQYDQKNMGADLIIVNQRDGSQEAFIKPAPIDVGMVAPPPPPPGYYDRQPQPAYPPQGYEERGRAGTGCLVGSAVIGGVLGNLVSNSRRHGAVGTVAGAALGTAVGNEACK